MKCPYSKMELLIAAKSAEDKLIPLMGKLTLEAENLLSQKSINEYVAHENSITVQELINSPNMAYMINSAKENLILKMIDIFKANGFTDEEAWACVTADQF